MAKVNEVNRIRNAFKKELDFASTGRMPKGTVKQFAQQTGLSNKQIIKKAKKFGIPVKSTGIDSFPGVIKKSDQYKGDTPGLFVQSVKGQKPKHIIEKSIEDAFKMMAQD